VSVPASASRFRLSRHAIVLPILAALLAVSELATAQTCYQVSNAQGDTPATVTATFPIASIPDSFVPPEQGNIDFTAAFSAAPGLDRTRVRYSPTHVATIVEGGTSHTFNTFNTFIVTIARDGTSRRLQFDGTNYPPTDANNTFSAFVQQTQEGSRRCYVARRARSICASL
jgi:hypothetical protein